MRSGPTTMTPDRMTTRPRSALLYADINLGAIGGASVWLATMAELLASAGCEVTLPLRGRRQPEMPLLRPLEDRQGIRIIEPTANQAPLETSLVLSRLGDVRGHI